MPSVISEIREWAKTIPYWEKVVLEKLLSGNHITQEDYLELLDYLLEEAKLVNPLAKHPELTCLNSTSFDFDTSTKVLTLNKIFNMQNINALVSGQTITFGPNMTAIFGENGSGKSGYARVLGCISFTRGDQDVLPDVTRPADNKVIRSADIEVNDGESTRIIKYNGNKSNDLAQCYVFDSTSVHVHLTNENTFSFAPAGLVVLTRLSEVTDEVREILSFKINELKKPQDFGYLFQGSSVVTDFIKSLNEKTDTKELEKLATLSDEETKKIGELDLEISRLKTQNIGKQIQKIDQTISDLQILLKKIEIIDNDLSDKTLDDLKKDITEYNELESISKDISVDKFKTDYFNSIGNSTWHSFVTAAKALAEEESKNGKEYPHLDDHCLLCRQMLNQESIDLMHDIWIYLESDIHAKLEKVNKGIQQKRHSLNDINLDFFNDQSVSYRYLHENNVKVLEQVNAYLNFCKDRKVLVRNMIDTKIVSDFLPLPQEKDSSIQTVVEKLKEESNQLQQQKITEKIYELSQIMLTLQHRQTLGKNLVRIAKYLDDLKWATRASKVGGDTKHITKKEKELFENLVTKEYLKIFTRLLENLKRPINVQVKTLGKKGKTYKRVVLKMDPSIDINIATPEKVLSEGEKRAVALADFLTEVTLDTSSSAIILDDPVTSLDFEWKGTIASLLSTEATKRQVILFTHDLPFLYLLKKYCVESQTNIKTHWIQRVENKPGYVFLDNSPAIEKEYCKTTRAEDFYKKAKDSTGEDQENCLRLGFGALRTCYEAFIIYEMFKEVVLRFDVRVSPGRLKDIKWDSAIAQEVNTKYEFLSSFIEGHLQSDGYTPKPDPPKLLAEINAFNELKKRQRALK